MSYLPLHLVLARIAELMESGLAPEYSPLFLHGIPESLLGLSPALRKCSPEDWQLAYTRVGIVLRYLSGHNPLDLPLIPHPSIRELE